MIRWVTSATALLALVAVPLAVRAQQQEGYHHGPHHMWDGGWLGMFLGPFMMIIFIAVAVVVVVLLIRWLGGPGHERHGPPPLRKASLDILKERFARGEIDKEEFEERRRVLGE